MKPTHREITSLVILFSLFLLAVGFISRIITIPTEPSTTVLMFAISASVVLGFLVGNSAKGE